MLCEVFVDFLFQIKCESCAVCSFLKVKSTREFWPEELWEVDSSFFRDLYSFSLSFKGSFQSQKITFPQRITTRKKTKAEPRGWVRTKTEKKTNLPGKNHQKPAGDLFGDGVFFSNLGIKMDQKGHGLNHLVGDFLVPWKLIWRRSPSFPRSIHPQHVLWREADSQRSEWLPAGWVWTIILSNIWVFP